MSYVKQAWATGDIITAEKLNHMEDGIAGGGSSVEYVIAEQTVTTNSENVAELNVDYEFIVGEWVIFKGENIIVVEGETQETYPEYVTNKFSSDGDGFANEMNINDNTVSVYIEDDVWYLYSQYPNTTFKISAIKMPNF